MYLLLSFDICDIMIILWLLAFLLRGMMHHDSFHFSVSVFIYIKCLMVSVLRVFGGFSEYLIFEF